MYIMFLYTYFLNRSQYNVIKLINEKRVLNVFASYSLYCTTVCELWMRELAS